MEIYYKEIHFSLIKVDINSVSRKSTYYIQTTRHISNKITFIPRYIWPVSQGQQSGNRSGLQKPVQYLTVQFFS